jgi:hypothetical protein
MMKDTDKNQHENQFYVTQDVDTYTDKVDQLIDLFGDVEDTLHSKYPVNITKTNLVDIYSPSISKQDSLRMQPYIMRHPEPLSKILIVSPEPVEQKANSLSRILLVVYSSTLIAILMWTINRGIWTFPSLLTLSTHLTHSTHSTNRY